MKKERGFVAAIFLEKPAKPPAQAVLAFEKRGLHDAGLAFDALGIVEFSPAAEIGGVAPDGGAPDIVTVGALELAGAFPGFAVGRDDGVAEVPV